MTAIIGAGMLIAMAACGSDDAGVRPIGQTVATPDIDATIAAQVQNAQVGIPTPTQVPASDRAAALEFAASHGAIARRWEDFHTEFDAWRQGLVSCSVNSVRSSLSGFAGEFAEIAASARALPRPEVTRGLSDTLVQAAGQELAALRLLRDTWQPGSVPANAAGDETLTNGSSTDSFSSGNGSGNGSGNDTQEGLANIDGSNSFAANSPFDRVDLARLSSAALRQGVADSLADRANNASPASLAEIEAFAAQFQSIESNWDQFHEDYDALLRELMDLNSIQGSARLGLLVDQFRGVSNGVRDLPIVRATGEAARILAQTAGDEDLALRKLRARFQETGGAPEGTFGEEDPDDDSSATIAPGTFAAFDAQLVATNGERLLARQELAKVQQDLSPESQQLLNEFTQQYDLLLRDWDGFHRDYDRWRHSDGGCNRSQVVQDLGRFSLTFSEIADDARSLPTATVLRPMGEIMVEAAEREERALKALRDQWQPYDAATYRSLDQERSASGKLRRQVAVGIGELLERFGISAE